jgi:hypothetical protein
MKVVLRHFHRHCYNSSLLWFVVEGTKALTRKLDKHENLRGLDHWSVISYVHGRYCIVVCVALMKTEFNLRKVDVV